MKIRPVGAEVSHANGQTDRQTSRETDRQTDRYAGRETERWTDMTKLMVAVVNFAKAHKNCS